MMTKRLTLWLLPIILLLNGCASNRIPLFNYDFNFSRIFGSKPDYVNVQKGDTLYSIARKYDIPLRELIETNHLKPPYNLYVGQGLRLPNARYHVVQKGDTVYNISKRYNLDMNSLSKANNLDEPYGLYIGQRLVLPGSVVASGYTPPPAPQKATSSSWTPWKSSAPSSTPASSYAPPPKKRSSTFAWPLRGKVISNYGSIGKGRNNDGINIAAPLGAEVKAADAGSVAYAGNELKGFGNLILIRHNDGWVTAYAHNDRILVKKGQKVRKGEKISTVGITGGVSSPQLHFEIRAGKKAVNPNSYLK